MKGEVCSHTKAFDIKVDLCNSIMLLAMLVSISYLVYGALYSVHPAVDSVWKQYCLACTFFILFRTFLSRSRIHEQDFGEVSGHNLESSLIEIFIYNVYIANQFQTTFARG